MRVRDFDIQQVAVAAEKMAGVSDELRAGQAEQEANAKEADKTASGKSSNAPSAGTVRAIDDAIDAIESRLPELNPDLAKLFNDPIFAPIPNRGPIPRE